LEVDLLDGVVKQPEALMITYELESVGFQRGAGADAASNALRLHRARNRNADSVFRHSATLEILNPVRRHTAKLQTETFQEMFETSRPRFLAIARTIVRNTEDAEDAVHNAYLSGYLNLRGFEGRSALTTWFTRIVVNAALMVQRKRRSSRVVPYPETNTSHESNWTERIASSQPDPEVAHGERETFQLINERLGHMKPLLRQAFIMIYFQELSIREACALLGVSSSTFKARLLRARRQLVRRVSRVVVAPIHQRKPAAGSGRPWFVEAAPSS
jgi:RNA polymerase sigma-70 factor (ECF subfamily)